MIIKNIKIFSQNVQKNKLLTDMILETYREFNIIFTQEHPWSLVQSIPSFLNKKRECLIGALHHSNWITVKDENSRLNLFFF